MVFLCYVKMHLKHEILSLLTCHEDVFGRMECLLTRYGVQCKFSVTVAVTVSSFFLHLHNAKPFKSDGSFCNLYFCGRSGSILPMVQFGIYKIKGKMQNVPASGKLEPQRTYTSL